ncbi:MAG: hypothetical protein HKN04_08710, partial [Rhodothermaceae bacterium]|nr:hypothetical protein [Rhodothermaceae bacterium]
ALLFATLVLRAKAWLTTEWSVHCNEETVLRLLDELGDPELVELNCHDDDITGAASIARGQLEDASPWLRDLGFPGPVIDQDPDGSYRAWIADDVSEHFDNAWGVYVPSVRELFLRSDFWIHRDRSGGLGIFLDRPSDRTMVHELFHAVQRPYRRDGSAGGVAYNWLWEGTAEGVEYAWFSITDPDAPVLHPSTARGLDESLHVPTPCTAESCQGAYRRYYFWSQLGVILGAQDRIQYLTHIFEQDLGPANGLTGLHTGLARWHRDGLYHYYPEFIARYGEPKDLFNDAGYREETLDPPGAGARTVEVPYTTTILPVATHAYDLIVPVPEDEAVGATVTLEGNDEALHLIVDGERLDYTSVGLDRNVYTTVLYGYNGPDTLRVRVANIGPEPADTEEEAYTLTLELDGGVEPCSEASFIAALNYSSPERAALVAQAAAMRQAMVAIDVTESVFMLGRGDMSINGDGGVACVTPFGVSDLEWIADQDENFDYDATEDELLARHLPRVSRETGVSEANLRLMMEGDMPAGVTPQQMMQVMRVVREIMAEPQTADPGQSGVFFHIFAPNLVPVVGGGVASDNVRTEDAVTTRHGGIGGWASNSAASVIVYLPGVQAADIRDGERYPARAYSLAPDDTAPPPQGPETSSVFYTRWTGDWETYRCGGTRKEDFDGQQISLWGRLEGSVTITSVTPTRVEGSFDLSGSGTQETFTSRLERTYDLDCLRRHETEEEYDPTGITISGTFAAPNMRAPLPFSIAGVGRAVPVGSR